MTSRVMVLGVGAFAHAVQTILREDGAETACYLTRPYSHFGPKIVGQTWSTEDHPSPLPLIEKFKPDHIYIHNTWFKASLGIFKIIEKYDINLIINKTSFQIEKIDYKKEKNCYYN